MTDERAPLDVKIRRALDSTIIAGGILAFALLLVELGFRLTAGNQAIVVLLLTGVLWTIAVVEIARLAIHPERRRVFNQHVGELVAAVGLLVLLSFKFALLPKLQGWWSALGPARVEMLYLGVLQLGVLAYLVRRSLYLNRLLVFARVSPRTILIGSYLLLVIAGAALLKLPNATPPDQELAWIDAFFTSTSAVCVTGLIVVDTATAFTPLGKAILLLLFQLGGLGLMTFTYFFVAAFGGGITIRDRALLLEYLNEENLGQITRSLIAIVIMTLSLEAAGAFLLHHFMAGGPGMPASWFDSVFHSVSAFCNAGFSTYTLGLFDPSVRGNTAFQIVIMILIVLGGLGFPVLRNLWENLQSRRLTRHRHPVRITTNSKIVIVTTASLLACGALAFMLIEYGMGEQAAYTPSWVTSMFFSVTARTAGFNTLPTEDLLPATAVALLFLMFIGGSPASAAGGIKTTTFAIAVLNTLHILRNASGSLVAFRRSIPLHLANRAFAVVLLSIVWLAATSLLLALLMPAHPFLDLLFEAVSAFSTVGLSRGVTADLPTAARILIIVSMIVGRIGILYAALGVLPKERRGRVSYPEGNVIIS